MGNKIFAVQRNQFWEFKTNKFHVSPEQAIESQTIKHNTAYCQQEMLTDLERNLLSCLLEKSRIGTRLFLKVRNLLIFSLKEHHGADMQSLEDIFNLKS